MGGNSENTKIDAVVYWVDGNDIEWQKKKAAYSGVRGQDFSPSRYREWDNLHYLFRGLEKFAPWLNRIFFVSDGQIPKWLNTEHPKLTIVDHKDYIPEQYLPVFNANPIELNFHQIKGLSEHFLVINDDFFFISPVSPEDFYRDGKPVDIFMEYPIMCGGQAPVFSHLLANDFNVIGKYYPRAEYKKRLRKKILSPKYGKYMFYNMMSYVTPYPKFFGLLTPHFTRPYLKSVLEEVWEKEYDILHTACTHRFRDPGDVNIYLFRIWNLMKGNFVPGNIFGMGKAFMLHDTDEGVCRCITEQKLKMICVNDDCEDEAFERLQPLVNAAFEQILPEKSCFER